MTPEEKSRAEIDKQLRACGWGVQDKEHLNLVVRLSVLLMAVWFLGYSTILAQIKTDSTATAGGVVSNEPVAPAAADAADVISTNVQTKTAASITKLEALKRFSVDGLKRQAGAGSSGNSARYDHAIEVFSQAIKEQPDSEMAWHGLGMTYFLQDKYDDSVAALRQAIKLKPDDSLAWSTLGLDWFLLGKYDDAVAACRQEIKLQPDDPKPWYDLGTAYMAQGKTDDASAAYLQAVKLKPNDPFAWLLVGCVNEVLGKRAEALDALDHLRKLDPLLADKLAEFLSGK